ncbi:MAG TPA: hypothetical protein DCW90_16815 [Lachnospiraceae bacterium]|nr:hypothetical protein [Lachnospiraceae bacterium]
MDKEVAIELLKNMLGPRVDYAEMVGGPPETYGIKYVYQDPEDYVIEEAIKALEKLERYKWHNLRIDSSDLPDAFVNYRHSFSDNVLVLRDGWNIPIVSYINLSTQKWFDSLDDEIIDNVIMWKYIEIPNNLCVTNTIYEED